MFEQCKVIGVLLLNCSVLDLDAFERTNKAEGLGMSTESTPGEKNLHDAEFICKLFRFLQLLCEGHNLGMFTLTFNILLEHRECSGYVGGH